MEHSKPKHSSRPSSIKVDNDEQSLEDLPKNYQDEELLCSSPSSFLHSSSPQVPKTPKSRSSNRSRKPKDPKKLIRPIARASKPSLRMTAYSTGYRFNLIEDYIILKVKIEEEASNLNNEEAENIKIALVLHRTAKSVKQRKDLLAKLSEQSVMRILEAVENHLFFSHSLVADVEGDKAVISLIHSERNFELDPKLYNYPSLKSFLDKIDKKYFKSYEFVVDDGFGKRGPFLDDENIPLPRLVKQNSSGKELSEEDKAFMEIGILRKCTHLLARQKLEMWAGWVGVHRLINHRRFLQLIISHEGPFTREDYEKYVTQSQQLDDLVVMLNL